jgi:hypothetical protein
MDIDEGGIDLLLDGDQVIAASFEGLDIFEVMRHILPEDRIKPEDVSEEDFLEDIAEVRAELAECSRETLLEAKTNGERDIITSLVVLAFINAELAK